MKQSGTDWKRLQSVSDDDIDLSDAPELDEEFFQDAEIRMPRRKEHVSLRIDAEVLEWFKGRGYQTRTNAVLGA